MKKFKKGFTIVELVIVIAVIAILAGVLIPVFSNVVDKANKSKDTQLVRNLNEALAVDLDEHNTMYDALQAAKEFGYDVDKINASATDHEILWDSVNDCFVYLNNTDPSASLNEKLEYIPGIEPKSVQAHQLWKIVNKIPTAEQTYSLYAGNGFTATDVEVEVGFDAGENADVNVKYIGDKDLVVIRTNGGELEVDNAAANLDHYGDASVVTITEAAGSSYHLFGQVGFLKVEIGHVVVENNAEVKGLHVVSSEATVTIETEAAVETVTVEDDALASKVTGFEKEIKAVDLEIAQTGATLFAGGFGTETAPYIIETAEQFQNISTLYEKGYNYFEIKEGVETIDCTDWVSVYLNGSFDGKGVNFTNLDKKLFYRVGRIVESNVTETLYLKNFDATFNVHAGQGASLIHNLFVVNADFNNVNIHGYLEGGANSAAYYNYGCLNGGLDTKMTVNFYDCDVDATLVSTSGNLGLYSGMCFGGTSNNKTTITVDNDSEWAGEAYLKQGSKLLKLCGVNAPAYLDNIADNVEITENVYANLVTKNPSKDEVANNYVVEKQSGASYVIVYINGQFTENDNNGNQIPNAGGITCTIGSFKLEWSEIINNVIFDKIDAVVFNPSQSGFAYTFTSNILTFSAGMRDDNTTGSISIRVCQYNENNQMISSSGELKVAEKTIYNGTWNVK